MVKNVEKTESKGNVNGDLGKMDDEHDSVGKSRHISKVLACFRDWKDHILVKLWTKRSVGY